jgi:hypothetical protein
MFSWQIVCEEKKETLGDWGEAGEYECETAQEILFMLLTRWAGGRVILTHDGMPDFNNYKKVSVPTFLTCETTKQLVFRNLYFAT